MDGTATALGRIRAETFSPDKTVKAKYSYQDGVVISFPDGGIDRHSESSLAEQIQLALNELLAGFRAARAQVQQRILDDSPAPPADMPIGAQVSMERKRRFAHLQEQVSLARQTNDTDVKIGIHASQGFKVRIATGTLRTRDADRLLSQVNTTLHEVMRAYKQRIDAIHREIYIDLDAASIRKALDERQYQHRQDPRGRD